MKTSPLIRFRPWKILFLAALFFAGCGGPRTTVKPVGSGPFVQAPSLVNVRPPVDEAMVKEAETAIEGRAVTAETIPSFLTVAQWNFNQGHMKEAAAQFQRIAAEGPRGDSTLRARYMAGEAYYGDKQYLAALAAFQKVTERQSSSDYGRQAKLMMEFLLKYSMDENTLSQFAANYPSSPFLCEALFQLGRRKADTGARVAALQSFKDYLARCPQHASAPDARMLITSLESQSTGQTRKLGILVPLTGSFAAYGQAVADGARLALEMANQNRSPEAQVELVVRDTQGSYIQAVQAAKALILEDRVDAILGPVRAEETGPVATICNQEQVVMLSPTATSDSLSTLGPYIFRNSMTVELQGRAIARFAAEKMGLKRFAILSPDDDFGRALALAFRTEIEALGSTVTAAAAYPPLNRDIQQALVTLGGRNPSVDKENERDNQRNEQQLVYSLKKEFLKAVLPLTASGGQSSSVAVAWAPFVEGLTNTNCPSVANLPSEAASKAWAGLKNPVRNQDLVEQALTRLPEEAQGNTLPVSDDVWREVMGDLSVNLLVTGAIIETDPPDEGAADGTWDFRIRVETRFLSASGKMRSSAVTLGYQIHKKAEFLRGAVAFDALYMPTHANPDEVLSLTGQLRFYDIRPQLLGNHLWQNEKVLREGGDAVEGALFVSGFWADSPERDVQDFVSSFSGRFGRRPDQYAAQSYDAARMLLEAFDGAQSREEVRHRLSGMKGFKGVSGETSFEGGTDKVLAILQIENGKLKQVQ